MKQLLIVNSEKALNAGASAPDDLSALEPGAICFWELGKSSFLKGAPKKNFAIALGRAGKSTPIVIPEVDVKTLQVMEASALGPVNFSAEITIPSPEDGDIFTLILVKKGAVPHERNTWTATETIFDSTKQTAEKVAEKLGNYFKAFADSGSLDINVSVEGAKISIEAFEGDWTLKCGDDLYGTDVLETPMVKAIDKKYIEDLASQCAAGKGFTDTYQNGDSIYPGYPEVVEDTTYNLFTLRFAVGRVSAKTRDEVVSQLVHIAVPASSAVVSALETILMPEDTEETEETEEEGNDNG